MSKLLIKTKQIISSFLQLSCCVFMFLSMLRVVKGEELTLWSVSFIFLTACYVIITLLGIFAILFRIDLNEASNNGVNRSNRRPVRDSQRPDEAE